MGRVEETCLFGLVKRRGQFKRLRRFEENLPWRAFFNYCATVNPTARLDQTKVTAAASSPFVLIVKVMLS